MGLTEQDRQEQNAALMDLVELNTRILEAVVGYRAACLAQGFSETAAEMMAMDYHHVLWQGGPS